MTPEAGRLSIQYVPLDELRLWDQNPKKHDLGALAQSVARYGFRDAPIYDATLGALVAGNGRAELLAYLRDQGQGAPNGIAVRDDGVWLVPVQVGIDAASDAEAAAFGLDHNNLTAGGSGLGPAAISALYEPAYLAMLQALAAGSALPESVTDRDLSFLIDLTTHPALGQLPEVQGQREAALVIRIRCPSEAIRATVGEALAALVAEHPTWEVSLER